MPNHRVPDRNINNKTSEYLQRDISSVEFKEEETSAGHIKIILLDKNRKHRSFAYVKKRGNIIATKNELAISYMSKFSLFLDLRKVGRAPSKYDKD